MRLAFASIVATAALAVAPLTAIAASTLIVPGQRIGPLKVAEERGSLRALGYVDRIVARTPDPAAPGNRNLDRVVVAYDAPRLVLRFPTDEESSVSDRILTEDPRYRTARGIGVGSTRTAVRAAYPAAVCVPTQCRIGVRAPGKVVTRFHLRSGRVSRVHLVTISG